MQLIIIISRTEQFSRYRISVYAHISVQSEITHSQLYWWFLLVCCRVFHLAGTDINRGAATEWFTLANVVAPGAGVGDTFYTGAPVLVLAGGCTTYLPSITCNFSVNCVFFSSRLFIFTTALIQSEKCLTVHFIQESVMQEVVAFSMGTRVLVKLTL